MRSPLMDVTHKDDNDNTELGCCQMGSAAASHPGVPMAAVCNGRMCPTVAGRRETGFPWRDVLWRRKWHLREHGGGLALIVKQMWLRLMQTCPINNNDANDSTRCCRQACLARRGRGHLEMVSQK
jgi:hypothetical protein